MCNCRQTVEDISVETELLLWWAYLHSLGTLHVKRWFRSRNIEVDCDLCHARKDKLQGNDYIAALVVAPFSASNREKATDIARNIFGVAPKTS